MNLSAVTTTNFSSQQTLPTMNAGQAQPLLVFYLGERAFGLLIENVVQIIPMLKITPLPQVGRVIEGVTNIHGKVVSVLNARRFLGMPIIPPRLYTPIILVQNDERMLGLIVDRVADVIHVPANQFTLPGEMMASGVESAAFLSGVVYQGPQAIVVLDPRCLLNPGQMQAVNNAIESIALADGSAADGGNGKVSQNSQSKPRRKRRSIEAVLAGEMNTLAADLPPSDGQPPVALSGAPVPSEPKASTDG